MAQSSFRGPGPDPMSHIENKASDQFGKVTDQTEHVASRVADQGRQVKERMQDVAGNFKGALNTSVKDQPMATLAAAAIAGFVLGALWKS